MASRTRITVTVDGAVFVTRGWRAAELLRDAGKRPVYSGSAGGWMLDRRHLGDVLAYLESRRIAVTVSDVDQPELHLPAGPEGGDAA